MPLKLPPLTKSTKEQINSAQTFGTVMNPYCIPERYEEFLRQHCRIRSGNKVIPFLPYEYQVVISDLIDKHRGIIAVKTRQMGFTECIGAKFLHKALLNPGYAAVVLSMGQDESSNVSVRIQNMPSKVNGLKWLTKSKTQIQPEGCGKVWFRPSTDNAARSLESVSDIFIDEHGFIENAEELYASAAPTQEAVGDEARTIIASTIPESGELSTFWQMFDADNGDRNAREILEKVRSGAEEPLTWWIDNSGWVKLILHWKSNPVYSIIPDYLAKTKREKKLTEDKLQREYNLGIPASGGRLFVENVIRNALRGEWQAPRPNRIYIAGIDPNFGGSDFFCTQIFDVTEKPYQLVAEYHENNRAVTYSLQRTNSLLLSYNPVAVAIESNSGGAVIAEKLTKFNVQTVNTTKTNKIANTDRLAILLEESNLVYPVGWIGATEMRNFSLKNREAITGHDDQVMSGAIAFTLIDEIEEKYQSSGAGFGFSGEKRCR
jgi:Terminase RNaseH-like domain